MNQRINIGREPFLFLIIAILVISCGTSSTSVSDVSVTATSLSLLQTMVALDMTVQANAAAQTQASLPTNTPIPTETLIPTPTSTPGPMVIQDDFSSDTGRWVECGGCSIQDGYMKMGPYPISQGGEGYLAICSDCGVVQDYKMGVDVTFVDGYTDRGFGLILREVGGSYIDVEVTTWQVYGAWIYDKDRNGWGTLFSGNPWKPEGALAPGYATNRVDVDVRTQGGDNIIAIYINNQQVNTLTTPAITGRVGLVVGLHSLGVKFDNFYFEGYPKTGPDDTNSGING